MNRERMLADINALEELAKSFLSADEINLLHQLREDVNRAKPLPKHEGFDGENEVEEDTDNE